MAPTPAPWTWVRVLLDDERPEHYVALGHDLSSETDTSVIEIAEEDHGCARLLIVNPADAALIASAPVLLAALEAALEAARQSECYGCGMPGWQGCMSYCSGDRIGNAIPAMQAAIAAARGDEADDEAEASDGR